EGRDIRSRETAAAAPPAMDQRDCRAVSPGPGRHSPIVDADAEWAAGRQEVADRRCERGAWRREEETLGQRCTEAWGGALESAHGDTGRLDLKVHGRSAWNAWRARVSALGSRSRRCA